MWSQTPTGSQAEVVFTHVAVCMGTFQVPRKLQLTVSAVSVLGSQQSSGLLSSTANLTALYKGLSSAVAGTV